jgi:hypothetical protein
VTIDDTGTSAQPATNFNAPSAVCKAAVLYVFRTLVDDEIPMNAGCLDPLSIVIPEGSMLSPRYPAAVVAGNVETSQAITDCLYGALGVMAASQGTMDNFTFGNDRYQYYETISGALWPATDFRSTALRCTLTPTLSRKRQGEHSGPHPGPSPAGAGEGERLPLPRHRGRVRNRIGREWRSCTSSKCDRF